MQERSEEQIISRLLELEFGPVDVPLPPRFFG